MFFVPKMNSVKHAWLAKLYILAMEEVASYTVKTNELTKIS